VTHDGIDLPVARAAPAAPAAGSAATIDVVGSGRAVAPPDVVRVRLAASALRPTVAAAITDSEAAATRVRAALAGLGVAAADATTVGLSVVAEQVWTEQQGSRITGFRSEHELLLTLRDLGGAGRVLGETLVAGGDDVRLHGVDFVVEDEAPLRSAAREAAWADALARAGQLAGLAGRPLGPVRQIVENSGGGGGPIVPMARMAAMAAPEIGIQPGTVGVDVTLTVQWAIG
jgi:uncharacterized protein YggE